MMMEGTQRIGRPITAPAKFKQLLESAGFQDVVQIKAVWPLSPWPKDPRMRELGHWSQADSWDGIEAGSLALFTRVLGWTQEDVKKLCEGVRGDLLNLGIHAFWNV